MQLIGCRLTPQLIGLIALASAVLVLFFNEFLIYYLQIAKCTWPKLPPSSGTPDPPVRAMILADLHMLGPHRGHWADKLRREWQMHRAFQTALTLHRPDVIFVLGDLFDEGQHVDDDQFDEYVQRYRQLFHVPAGVQLYGALGNHDVGFHYRMRLPLLRRFRRAAVYQNAPNALITVGRVNFVIVNSMAMQADGCTLCRSTEATLRRIAERLNCRREGADREAPQCRNETSAGVGEYTAPVLLQHFPTWRRSDAECTERDTDVPLEEYRGGWEALTEPATRWLADVLEPRAVFSGHSHYYCRTRTVWGADEWTVNSFSWRNNDNPKFLLAMFAADAHAVAVCAMPRESTVLTVYAVAALLVLLGGLVLLWRWWRCRRRGAVELVDQGTEEKKLI